MAECVLKDKGGYFQITNFNLEVEDFHHQIFQKIEDALKIKKQDVLLSLAAVGVLYSSHLAILVRIHQMMYKNNLRFVISDISPEIKNLLQITQLDSIFSIYETLDDFKNSLKTDSQKQQSDMNFEWQMSKNCDDVINVECKGNMFAGEQLDKLQKSISDFFSIVFDFANLQSMDSTAIAFLDKLVENRAVSIVGANAELVEQFRQKLIYGKVKLL